MMPVGRAEFQRTLDSLAAYPRLSLDTETTGLRPYHGDSLFSIIIATPDKTAHYFNFWAYADMPLDYVLPREWLVQFRPLFADSHRTWYMHNAKFDLHMLAKEGLTLSGTYHCTRAIARLARNDLSQYTLEACLSRIGLAKSMAVDEEITKKKLYSWEVIPGKLVRSKRKHFERVKWEIMVPYGMQDASGTLALGEHQEKTIVGMGDTMRGLKNIYPIDTLMGTEQRLTRAVFQMEQRGVLIDKAYSERASNFEESRFLAAAAAFEGATGQQYSSSGKLFETVFVSDRERFVRTEKGQWCFDADVLETFTNPAAKFVLQCRDAKAKANFYQGFSYHADQHSIVHPSFNTDGARTGRFSSSAPNLQNLKKDDEEGLTQEYVVRRAIVPRNGYIFIMPDYVAMEYALMLEYAKEMPLIERIQGGLDVHQATADMMGVGRREAKTLNFFLLYGGGAAKLGGILGISTNAARDLKRAYFHALPRISSFIDQVVSTARTRGYLHNWAGRKLYVSDPELAYRGPNMVIQSGCADIIKRAMVEVAEYLVGRKSHMLLSIHDELVLEVHEEEIAEVPRRVATIMESVFPAKLLPMRVGMAWSAKSLADKAEGYPDAA